MEDELSEFGMGKRRGDDWAQNWYRHFPGDGWFDSKRVLFGRAFGRQDFLVPQ